MTKVDDIFQKNTNAVLTALGFTDIAEADKPAVMEELGTHFYKIITETLVINLSDEQIREFQKIIKLDSDARDEKIMELAASIPGLSQKLEAAVEAEFMILRAAKNQITTT
jgi:hypothetical protein